MCNKQFIGEKHSLSIDKQSFWQTQFFKLINIVFFLVDEHSLSMKNVVLGNCVFRSKNRVFRKGLLFDLENTIYRPINCVSRSKNRVYRKALLFDLENTVYRPTNCVFRSKNTVYRDLSYIWLQMCNIVYRRKTQFIEWQAECLTNTVFQIEKHSFFLVDKHSLSTKNVVLGNCVFRSKNRVFRKGLLFDLENTIYRPTNCVFRSKNIVYRKALLTVYRVTSRVSDKHSFSNRKT